MVMTPIDKFWTKLLAATQSPNKIPNEYLTKAFNCRIVDGGIWPRKGKNRITSSTLWTVNQGAFFLNWEMYQVANSKIYRVDKVTGVQTEIVDIGYDQRTDVLVYDFPKGSFVSSFANATTYTLTADDVGSRFEYNASETLQINEFDPDTATYFPQDSVASDGSTIWKPVPAVKVLDVWTDADLSVSIWGATKVWNDFILLDWQFINANSTGSLTNDISVQFGYYESEQRAIIVSDNNTVKVFDWETLVNEQELENSGIIEFTRGYSFLAQGNNLLISAPVTADNPENAYDFTWGSAQSIIYDTEILGLEGTLNGLYVFTKNKVEFLGSNSLQNIAWSATFISTVLGVSGELINNHCIASIGDKIFYLTKDLHIQTINYIGGTDSTSIWELSKQPIVGIEELLKDLDTSQPYSFGYYNKDEKNTQFHVRTIGSRYNDLSIVYDYINTTWSVDTNKNYNWIINDENNIFWFSDINTSIFQDSIGFSDAGQAIPFEIETQDMNMGTNKEKLYNWLYTAWILWELTDLEYTMTINWQSVFNQSFSGQSFISEWSVGTIGTDTIGTETIGWGNQLEQILPFDKEADAGRIFKMWIRAWINIKSSSIIQRFLIDTLWIGFETTGYNDINNKF